MSQDTPDESPEVPLERSPSRRTAPSRSSDQTRVARATRTTAGKATGGSKRAFRLARGELSPRARSVLKRALRAAVCGSRKNGSARSRNLRGVGVRGPAHHAQRVVVKARVAPVRGKSPADVVRNQLAYLERDGTDRDGGRGRLFDAGGELDREGVDAFAERARTCRHQFRFIVSPERGGDVDLERFTRDLARRMEHDLGTALDYVACVHRDTDQPHVHIVVNGRDDRGGDLVISRDYIANGLRHRAMDLATNALGYRSDLDVLQSLGRDITAERFTALDRRLQTFAERNPEGFIDLRVPPTDPRAALQRRLYLGRLAQLRDMGLASHVVRGVWQLEPVALDRLRGLTQHRDIQRHVQRHVETADRAGSIEVVDKATLAVPVTGRVLGRGLANELSGTAYLVVAGLDGKTYYTALSGHSERHLERGARTGDLVTLRRVQSRASGHADRNVVEFAKRHGGLYDPQQHRVAIGNGPLPHDATPERYVEAHVVRMQALASRGFVTPESNGRYRIPPDLIERLHADPAQARDSAFVRVDVRGRDLRAQAAARAVTWLDEQLVAGVPQLLRQAAVRTRFQDELVEAAEQRVKRLVQLGLAQVEGGDVRLDAHLTPKLARLERDDAAARLSQQFGRYIDIDATGRFSGRVAAIETLASGPHAVVVNGERFTLVPAERGLAQRVGKDVSLTLAHARGPDAEQTRVRFRVLDALDLSPSLGR